MTRAAIDLGPFFAPDGVALIGQLDRTRTEPELRATNDERWGPGNWHLVNPKGGALGAVPVHRHVGDIGVPVTLAVLSTPAAACPDVVRACGAAGVRFALVFSGGFSEVGPAGADLERQLAVAGREAGVSIVGPNTNTNAFERLPDVPSLRGRKIAVVTQSGHNGRPIVQGTDFGIGFSRLIPTGNEVDVDICDVIEHLATDDDTGVICAYVEGFHDGPRLQRALEAAHQADKPVVMMKIGSSEAGARMAQTHTGHMVGSDAIVDAILQRHGVTRVRDLDELLETSALFAKLPPASGPRVGLYSISGGSAALMAELAELHGVPMPQLSAQTQERLHHHIPGHLTVANPVDNGGTFVLQQPPEVRRQVMQTILDDPAVDVLVVGITGAVPPMTDLLADDVRALADRADKPIVATWNSLRVADDGFDTLVRSGVPLFRSFRNCFAALGAVETRQRALTASRPRVATSTGLPTSLADRLPDAGLLDPALSSELLTHFGVPVLPQAIVTSAADATAAAGRLGVPVALKTASTEVAHKSDLGLVRLGVELEDVGAAHDELTTRAARAGVGDADRVLVQPMAEADHELLIGLLHDPVLGAAMVVGLGGVYTEVLADRAVRPLPIDRRDAQEMVDSLRSRPLLAGARGRPAADVAALVSTIERVGSLAHALGDRLAELDLNPVLVHAEGHGVAVADSLIVVAEPPNLS